MLKIEDLHITIKPQQGPPRPMVQGVKLRVRKKRPLIIMGETGCGKSLIAQAVFRLLPPEMSAQGQIHYGGEDLLSYSDAAIRRLWGREIFLFPQEPGSALNPLRRSKLQVTEIFRWVVDRDNGSANRPREYRHLWKKGFTRLGLSLEDGRKYPWQLSGGMSQRLLAVMALSEPARLIVADEPTKGLDPGARTQTIQLLKEMMNSGKGVFIITHDPELPRQLGGDLAVMYDGMVMESGPAGTILDSPRHPYTRALLNALPENGLHPIPLRVNGNTFQGGCPFSPRCTQAQQDCFHLKPPLRHIKNDKPCIAPTACSKGRSHPSIKPRKVCHDPTAYPSHHSRWTVRCHLGCQS